MTTYINALKENDVFEVFNDWVTHSNPRFLKHSTRHNNVPVTSQKEHEDHFEYKFNLAGASKDNIKLSLQNKNIVLKVDQGELNYYTTFPVPNRANANKAEAAYRDGILSLKVFKHEKLKPINIDIK